MATVRRGRLQQEAAQQYSDGYAFNPEYGAQHTHKVVNPLQLIDTVDAVIPSNTVSDILTGKSSAGASREQEQQQQQHQHVADTNTKATAHFYIPHLHASSDSSDALGPSASSSSIVNPAHPLNRRAPPPPPQCTTTTEEITAAISATDLSGLVVRGAGDGPETVLLSDVLAGTALRKNSVKTVSTTTAAAYIHPLPYTPLPAEARDALWVKGVLSHRSSHAFDKWLAAEAYIEEEDSIREAEEKEREMEARRNRRKQQQRGLLFLDFAGSSEHQHHKGGRLLMEAAEVGSTSAWSDFESHSVITEGPVGSAAGGIGHCPSFSDMRRGGGGVGSSATATTAASMVGGRTRGGGGGGTGTASVSSFGGGRPLRAIDVRSQVKSRTKRAREEEGSLLTTSALLSLAAETNNTNASGQTNVPNSLFEWQRQEPLLPPLSSSSSPPLRPFPAPDPLPMMIPSASSSSLAAAAAAAAATTGLSRRELKNRAKEQAHQQHLLIAQHAALRNRSTSGERRSASMASSSCAANVTAVGSGISVLPTNTSTTMIKKEDGVVGSEAVVVIDAAAAEYAEDESDKVSSVGAFAGSDADEGEDADADEAEQGENDNLASSGNSNSNTTGMGEGRGDATGAEQQIKPQSTKEAKAKAKTTATNIINRSSNSTPIAILTNNNNKNNNTTAISTQQVALTEVAVGAGKSLSPQQGSDSALHLPPPPALPTTTCDDKNALYPYPPQYTIEYGPASVACGLYEKGKARRRAEVVLDRRTPSSAHHSSHFFSPPPPLPLSTRSSVLTPNDSVLPLRAEDSACNATTAEASLAVTSEEAPTHTATSAASASASASASIVSLAENSTSALLLKSLPPPPNPNTLTQLMYLEKTLAMYRLVLNEANGILMGCGQFKERAALFSNIDTALSPQLTSHIVYLTQAVRVTEGEISKLEKQREEHANASADDVKAGGTDSGVKKKKDASRGLSPSPSSDMFINGGGGDVGVDVDEDDYDGNAARIRAVRLTCDVLKRQLDKLKDERDSAMAAVASFALNAGGSNSRGAATVWGSSLLMSGGGHLTSSSSDATSTSLEGEGIGVMSFEGVPLPPSGPSAASGGQPASNTTNSSSRVRTRPKNANNPISAITSSNTVPVVIPPASAAVGATSAGDNESIFAAAASPMGVANSNTNANNAFSSFATASSVPDGDRSNTDGGAAANEGSSLPPSTLAFPLPLPTLFLRPAPVDAIIAEDEATRLVRFAFSSAKGGLRRDVADPFNLLQDKTRKAREALRKSYTAQQTAARLVIAKNVATVVEKVLSSSSLNRYGEVYGVTKKGLTVEGGNEGSTLIDGALKSNEDNDDDENDLIGDDDDGAEDLSRTLGEDAVMDDDEDDDARQTLASANKKVCKSSRHQSKLKRRGGAAAAASSARRTPTTTTKRTAPLKKDSVLSKDRAPKVSVSTRSTRRRAIDDLNNATGVNTNDSGAQMDANPAAGAEQQNNNNNSGGSGGEGRRLVGALLRREREITRQVTGRSTATTRNSAKSTEGQREEEAPLLSTGVTTRRTRRRATKKGGEEAGADGL